MFNNIINLGGLIDGYKTKLCAIALMGTQVARMLGYKIPVEVDGMIAAAGAWSIRDAISKNGLDK